MTITKDNKYDIGIIGGGVAGAFAALRLSQNYPHSKSILFDLGRPPGKRRRQLEGWFGCFPVGDGKLYTDNLTEVKTIVDGRKAHPAQTWVMQQLESAGTIKVTKDSLPTAALQKKIQEQGYSCTANNYIQWKPESIHLLSKNFSAIIEETKAVESHFDNEVYSIIKKKNLFIVTTANGEFSCQRLILCVGRSGWRWVTQLYRDLGLIANDDWATFGVRAEISGQYLKDFNHSHCSLKREGMNVGPFSWGGTVIPEDHADVAITAFRSNEERWKSEKVSFSILASQEFKDQGVYQTDRLAKLAYLLFDDRVNKEKVRVFLKQQSQLSLLPEYTWLNTIFTQLDQIIPQFSTRGSFHAPNISALPAKINLASNLESELAGMFVAGESAGISGILAAAIMGTVAADSAAKSL